MRRGISDRFIPFLVVVVAFAGSHLLAARPAEAATCAGAEGAAIYLWGFPRLMADKPPFFYYTPEKDGNAPFEVTAFVGCGGTTTYRATYDTPPGSPNPADAGDYERVTGRPEFYAPQDHAVITRTFQVPIHDDAALEPLAETVSVELSELSSGADPGTPMKAPLYIVDDEGPERVRFVTSSMTVGEAAGVVRIPVLRAGALDGGVSFSVSPASDVTPTSGNVQLAPDGRFGIVSLNVADDSQSEPVETLSVSLSGGAVEGGPFSLNVTDNDGGSGGDTIAPHAWFDHPRHGVRYSRDDPLLHSIELLATDNSGRTAITGARAALRKKLKAGGCRWWSGTRWQAGACSSVEWFALTTRLADGAREVFVYTALPHFAPSIGHDARTRNYRVYGRATDDSGNTSPLVTGDSRNTFEVTRA
jgi:hypothetical protein